MLYLFTRIIACIQTAVYMQAKQDMEGREYTDAPIASIKDAVDSVCSNSTMHFGSGYANPHGDPWVDDALQLMVIDYFNFDYGSNCCGSDAGMEIIESSEGMSITVCINCGYITTSTWDPEEAF